MAAPTLENRSLQLGKCCRACWLRSLFFLVLARPSPPSIRNEFPGCGPKCAPTRVAALGWARSSRGDEGTARRLPGNRLTEQKRCQFRLGRKPPETDDEGRSNDRGARHRFSDTARGSRGRLRQRHSPRVPRVSRENSARPLLRLYGVLRSARGRL